ncbi:foldase protein PrsA [Paenibacillus sp. UNCCL117]|uniref:peptidylprolyl isomerase n=1 Tax=unclassified Paenibacillus TaxID=185978 RepID=UPI00089194B8|nr:MULTISPECIES: peptidylprolyl isomerase [unclassified Paenibacillus]SDC42855.1 foldase protein PrsA [Paenibacillus sp. cl123]SFW13120.1 foldase protein PrsA [Paenibacillus sp. UNCCL117]
MKDKFKGLVLGLSLGAMLTGTAAYASGTQIEVYFRELKYMFDGIEKKPSAEQGAGFIHNGTTYVPLRFVSEALGKEVGFDEETSTIWVGKRIDMNHPVALYKGGQIIMQELQNRLALDRAFSYGVGQADEDVEYQHYLLEEMIGYRVLAAKLSDAEKTALAPDVEKEFALLVSEITRSAPDSADAASKLAQYGLSEKYLHSFAEQTTYVRKALTNAVTDAQLKSRYEELAAAGEYHRASVRHILIGFEDASGKARTKADAKAKAQQLADKLRQGADFAELAKQESDDPGSKEDGGLYEDAPVNGWVEPFKKATMELKLNEISEPVETEYGYHLIRVEARTVSSFEDEKENLLGEAMGDRYAAFIEKELPGLIEKIDLP